MARVRTRQRSSGKYSYFFEVAPVGGKRKRIERGGFDTEEQAYNEGVKAFEEYNESGSVFRASDSSLADFMDKWAEGDKMNVKNNTHESRLKMIKCHIKPDLGGYRLKDLSPATVDEWVKGKVMKSYAYSTIECMLKVLKQALDYAVYPAQLLRDNPARLIKIPRAAKKGTKERHCLSQDEIQAILGAFPFGNTYHVPIMIGLHTGLRIGEVLGLTWENVDLDNGTITVEKQLQRVVNNSSKQHTKSVGTWYFETTKTNSSKRTIKIGSTLINTLKRWKVEQSKNKLLYGKHYVDCYQKEEVSEKLGQRINRVVTFPHENDVAMQVADFVCTQPCGDFIKFTTFTYATRVARTKIGVDFDFHTLRHTHATMLIEGGAKIKDVSVRLGHSSVDITMDTYTHDTDAMQNETVAIFEKAMI